MATLLPAHLLRKLARAIPLLVCVALLSSVLVRPASAATTGTCAPPTVSTLMVSAGGGTYTLGRDNQDPPGTMLTPWSAFTRAPTNLYTCDVYNTTIPGDYWASLARVVIPFDPALTTPVNLSGLNYRVYQTNVPGVGMIVAVHGGDNQGGRTSFSWKVEYTAVRGDGLWTYADGYRTNETYAKAQSSFALAFAFVKTGPITSGGTVSFGGVVAQGSTGTVSPDFVVRTSYATPVDVYLVNGPTFVVASCTTPDVAVNLGTHQMAEFTGANYTSAPVDFNIKLNSCMSGMRGIMYRIDPTTTVLDSTKAVVAVDATSTATGVGVQLLDGAGAVHPLGAGTDRTFTPYSSTTGGSYVIPLKARYYQTSPTVTAGAANTTMMFTMSYQ